MNKYWENETPATITTNKNVLQHYPKAGRLAVAQIRGVLAYTQIMSTEKLKEERDRFMADYFTMSNSGGVMCSPARNTAAHSSRPCWAVN